MIFRPIIYPRSVAIVKLDQVISVATEARFIDEEKSMSTNKKRERLRRHSCYLLYMLS